MSIFDLPVHPAAAVFPMLPDDELQELALDIRAKGLVHPIVVKDGVLIDGRNRRAACKIAGVEPQVTELNGQDPVAYILSSNIARRHMNKGQRAMAVAMIWPEPQKLRRKDASPLETKELGQARLSQARTVLKWAPEMSDGVLSGAEALDKAYAIATTRRQQREAPTVRLAALRARDPDLADQVSEERLALEEAEAAAKARRDKERVERQGVYDSLRTLEQYFFVFCSEERRQYVARICQQHADELSAAKLAESLDKWIDVMTQMRAAL